MRVLAIVLLFASTVSAQTVIDRYVGKDCANNGDGTASGCAGSPGGVGAYNTACNAFSDIQSDYPDFQASNVRVDLHLLPASAEDTCGSAIYVLNSGTHNNTDTTRYLRIMATGANAPTQPLDTAKYRMSHGGAGASIWRVPTNANVDFIGVQCISRVADANRGPCFSLDGSTTTGRVRVLNSQCFYDPVGTPTTHARNTCVDADSYGGTLVIANTLSHNFRSGFRIRSTFATGSRFYLYNNTISSARSIGLDLDMSGTTDTAKLRNNIIVGSTTTDYVLTSSATTFASERNITSDATSPDVAYRSKTITFENVSTGDLRIVSSETDAIDQGANLSADPDFAFSDDFLGTTRPSGSAWDIGAHEYISAATTQLPVLQAIGAL